MKKRLSRALAACLLILPLAAHPEVRLLKASASELQVGRAGQVTYTVRTDKPGTLVLSLLTGDADVVRRIVLPAAAAGEHGMVWDGRDDRGERVPDEAYCPRVELDAADGTRGVDDPCTSTGGELLDDLQPRIAPTGDISYTLSQPARVLIRVGLKGGAMLRSLSVWSPHPAGRNLQRWNGFDESGLVDLRTDRLSMLVVAFRLPAFAVITSGNPSADYRSYRLARGWPEPADAATPGSDAQPLERGGRRIARQHYMARFKDREPRISVKLSTRDGAPLAQGTPAPDEVRVSVDLHPDDRWLLQESLYEVGFFVDGSFVSEEENGYTPISWIWDTRGLSAGQHLLTVNLTGFSGRVGTRTVAVSR